MYNIKGKRLLLLGGGSWNREIKAFAEANDIVLVATGNDPRGGIFSIADESYAIDSTNSEAMKRLIIEKHIDGVYMGGCEPVIEKACGYLGELQMPCYCIKPQWEALQDKSRFKQLCLKFGLPCAPQYELDSKDIQYPVVTKPTDGSGGLGFSVCRNREELIEGYAKAKAVSRSGHVLIEQFSRCNDGIIVYYTFSNGQIYFSSIESKYAVRYTDPERYVSVFHIFESSRKEDFLNRFEDRLQKMFRYLGLREGTVNIEVFCDGDNYYFNEAGYRYLSHVSFYPINYYTGVNQLEMDIVFALTGKSSLEGHGSLFPADVPRKSYYCMYCVQMRFGRIVSIEGIKELSHMPECVHVTITKHVGDEIVGPRTLNDCFGFIHIVFDTVEELHQIVNKIHDIVHVTDTEGREMLIDMMDWENRKIVI